MQKLLISFLKSNISHIKSLDDVIIYCQISQLDKNLKNKPNKLLFSLKASQLELLVIDSKLSNISSFFRKSYNVLL